MVAPHPPTRSVSGARWSSDSDWSLISGTLDPATVSQHSPGHNLIRGLQLEIEKYQTPSVTASFLAGSFVRVRTTGPLFIIL